ncbi:MAG TPA: hypothetical protein VMV60_15025 [Thermoanaerobaculia bacterium]|nr:hypothetical protein [Thermoanaerobaculia bacterium]
MEPTERRAPALAAGAAFAFVLAGLSYLPATRFLHYASFSGDVDAARLAWLVPLAIAGAFAFERIVRGAFYGWLRTKLPAGLAAPAVAALGAVPMAAARLAFGPRFDGPPVLGVVHAYLVALALGLGLAWLALGTRSTIPGGAALAAVWAVKAAAPVISHGRPVPLFELLAAALAAAAAAFVLRKPLAPHRDAMWGA